ncbi:protein involved in catabolism of external DNA [Legionella sainthelensi]|uniref:Ribosomal RNA large subunit methyltransferase J n=1 Tax=Legionella sainthelensi TaxID=28087 RepID=A0A0W0YGI3_9GAMM|nr:23S rRNA (adenine(2030)-N(6))-methyltransferase RlmJ [Legionella sainthelensi]KTD56081.1 protein involved in catabolism of external DNA [Legionella sainthelensi]VEH35360.1 protein involved in catabolism of external DNA [Legionella sainthelensi]
MLSYQHGYHAGNFADVIKHVTLTRLLCYLTLKDKPLFYLETHSGKGLYDLKNKQAEKTKEYQHGIQLLWSDKQSLSPLCQDYLNIVSQLNPTSTLRYYPGSPYLAVNLLRKQDRMYFCELHPREFEVLTELPRFNKKVHFSKSDGLLALKALLPPPEKRGLIFIDPSFEIKEEYKEIPIALKQAYARFSTGVYCLWYPLVDKKLTDKLNRGMKDIKNTLHIEFSLTETPIDGMYGCGLWIINPPFTLAEEIKSVLTTLKCYFNPESYFSIIEAN